MGMPGPPTSSGDSSDSLRRDAALKLRDELWSVAVVQALVRALKDINESARWSSLVVTLAALHRHYPE
jgi:hypothetical protein